MNFLSSLFVRSLVSRSTPSNISVKNGHYKISYADMLEPKTLAYCAPEVLELNEDQSGLEVNTALLNQSPKADVFSLAVTVYKLLLGRLPDRDAGGRNISNCDVVALRTGLSEEFQVVIVLLEGMLNNDPAERWSAEAVSLVAGISSEVTAEKMSSMKKCLDRLSVE